MVYWHRENCIGSYDEAYTIIPELTIQVLLANPCSIATCSLDLSTNQWMATCIAYKGSIEGFLQGCRPVLGLDGYFLKGKYEGVCLSIIGLDGNNGIFPIAVYFCRQKGLIEAVGEIFPNANHRYRFRHMYKNMKTYHKGTYLDREPYEYWARSHFDFSSKCEHITNNFNESFNNWILKIRDKPLHKAIECLNLMLMKLMYDRRLKATEWD
ncbi:hypothetical protein GIB67_016127 [Kingdonia uniflora]|uniref:Uncharacterized protein n=1 Tax=Kingdonia uniflora TaxID=39325 RepID=A0A7J7L214_9MAGN|nr:hypothetical protein GIB67_016127 [Kingdonia uniflora]